MSGFPYTGPSVFLFNDGSVKFRLSGTNNLGQLNIAQVPRGWIADVPINFKFLRIGRSLQIWINNVMETQMSSDDIEAQDVTNTAPLRIGGNHVRPTRQNLHAVLTGVRITNRCIMTGQPTKKNPQ